MITITELTKVIKNKLLNEKYIVQGEISDIKISQGHTYFTLKDQVSSVKGVIWSSNKNVPRTEIKNGIVIETDGYLNYYDKSGSVTFVINKLKIISVEGILKQKYSEWNRIYTELGYFTNKLIAQKYITNIVIITSETGAALQDFLYVLKKYNYNGTYKIINTIVQGEKCVKSVCDSLKNCNFINPELVVITRGGGSFEDLIYFSEPEILEEINNLRKNSIMTLSAIGHETDLSLTEKTTDIRCPTPSLAAEWIIQNNNKFSKNLINDFVKFLRQEQNKFNFIKEMKDFITQCKSGTFILDENENYLDLQSTTAKTICIIYQNNKKYKFLIEPTI
jgi:exodeoxyribonuclease VII large subunit